MGVQLLRPAMDAGADSLPGWQLLSELQLQNEQPEPAAESAARGLKCLAQRRGKGYLGPPEVAAGIVLARGYSLLALERLDEAQAMFNALTGILVLPESQPLLASSLPCLPCTLLHEGIEAEGLVPSCSQACMSHYSSRRLLAPSLPKLYVPLHELCHEV